MSAAKTHKLENETPIMPWIIADSTVQELGGYLFKTHNFELVGSRELADKLADRANAFYQANAEFRKNTRKSPTFGRNYLYTFMRHWLAAELYHSGLRSKIPARFANGEPI